MRNPRWLREFEAALQLSRQFVLWGNVRDLTLVQTTPPALLDLPSALWSVLSRRAFRFLVVYDPVDGIRLHPGSDAGAANGVVGRRLSEESTKIEVEELGPVLRAIADPRDRGRGAAMIDYASRLRGPGDTPSDEVHEFHALCEKLSHTSPQVPDADGVSFVYNPIVWVLDQERDLPAWLTGGNVDMRLLPVPAPDLDERAAAAAMVLGTISAERITDKQAAVSRLAAGSDGFRLRGLVDASRILKARPDIDIDDAIRACKLGTDESPWRGRQLWSAIDVAERDVEHGLAARVLGQEVAVTRALDILKRSAVGLSGAQASSQPSRPRGVMFFAGPTGVGKTELAKALTKVVFGDEGAMKRFDMSEYGGEENAARLIGAPPGFTGHDAGGELTNAVRERPFRLLLFDEIDKAHPSILDNFLQILDDGRLTDGQGATVHFTECLIVFTSNLGILTLQPDDTWAPNVTAEDDYEVVRETVEAAIKDEFHRHLKRPELLNRIGDNVVVFDFIRPPIDRQIFDLMVENVLRRVRRAHGVELTIAPQVRDELAEWATADLSYGGRGIGNRVETALVNPLARAMFRALGGREQPNEADFLLGQAPQPAPPLRVVGASRKGQIWTLDLLSA